MRFHWKHELVRLKDNGVTAVCTSPDFLGTGTVYKSGTLGSEVFEVRIDCQSEYDPAIPVSNCNWPSKTDLPESREKE